MRSTIALAVAALAPCLLVGCASYYNAPGAAADMSVFGVSGAAQAALTDSTVASAMQRRPAASLPTVLAVARVQGSGYTSHGACGYGNGRYSVVTSLDAERPEDIDRLRKLAMVRDVVFMNRLVLPRDLNSDIDLRAAAGALHADMLLVYTFDTTFRTEDFASPLTVVTLGLFPGKSAKVHTTASAAILDTRTGYIYATATGASKQSQLANAWTSDEAADDARLRAEQEALGEVLTSLEQTWPRLVMDSPNWSRAAPTAGAGNAPAGSTYWTVPGR
jgi:hypothetical protein